MFCVYMFSIAKLKNTNVLTHLAGSEKQHQTDWKAPAGSRFLGQFFVLVVTQTTSLENVL